MAGWFVHALHPPRIEGPLTSAAIELDHDADLDELDIAALTATGSPLHDVRIQRSRLHQVSVAGLRLTGFDLRDAVFDAVDAAGTHLGGAQWTRVECHDCRLVGLDLSESVLRHVSFRACRLDDANFRLADLERIAFDDCTLGNADFGGARLHSITFAGSHLDDVDFSNARVEQLDLRGARLGRLLGIGGLRGSIIGVEQVLPLVPALFAELGITIAEEPGPD